VKGTMMPQGRLGEGAMASPSPGKVKSKDCDRLV
jgi:hypothetical protein